jgi:hypothetical protein
LLELLRALERSRDKPYYEREKDEQARTDYYTTIDADQLTPDALYRALNQLLTDTHTNKPAYKPSGRV